jgi:lipoprotein-anchoring transpeptidase ErfK/SrfK
MRVNKLGAPLCHLSRRCLVAAQSCLHNSVELFRGAFGGPALRVCTKLAVTAVALALSISGALAQYYPPPPPPYSGYALPPSAYPPAYPSQTYSSAPLAPPGYYDDDDAPVPARPPYGRGAIPGQQTDAYPPAPRPYFMPNDPYSAQPLPSQGPPGLRPPADVGGAPGPGYATGSVPPPPAAAPQASPTVLAALPPDEQPEQGPRKELPPQFRRQLVDYPTTEPPGTVIIDTPNTYLYLTLGQGKAMRYGIGVGREGFTWAGTERVSRMKEWPDWLPPKEMIDRQPYLPRFMAGGETNPLGARALYLGNTLYRIHGTNQPSTIGTFVSSGCIRLTNEDIADLYGRVQVGTRIVVLPGSMPATASSQGPANH